MWALALDVNAGVDAEEGEDEAEEEAEAGDVEQEPSGRCRRRLTMESATATLACRRWMGNAEKAPLYPKIQQTRTLL